MAGDWIKMRGNLWDDPRVARIVDMTDSSEAAVVGGLYWLWATADQHTEDGVMLGLTLKAIDRKTGLAGFASALCAIGWIADHPEGVRIVDFEKHNGMSAKKRCQTAKRVATHSFKNAALTDEERTTNAASVSSALAREEKRREDKEKKDKHAPAAPLPVAPDDEPNGPDGPARASVQGQVCLAMKAAGITSINPSHPELRALLERGADIGMFVGAAQAASGKGKGFAYALATVAGQMRDAAALAAKPLAVPIARPQQAESFAAQDQRMKRRAWEEMTGESWPADDGVARVAGLVIDINETALEANKNMRIA
jgi:hypothetical protein